MRLVLGEILKHVSWPEANMEFILTPLYEDDNAQLLKDCTERVSKQGKLVDVIYDHDEFSGRVGLKCIKDWPKGPVDEHGQPVPCTPENIKRLMKVGVARDFILAQVRSLDIHLQEEIAEAKNA